MPLNWKTGGLAPRTSVNTVHDVIKCNKIPVIQSNDNMPVCKNSKSGTFCDVITIKRFWRMCEFYPFKPRMAHSKPTQDCTIKINCSLNFQVINNL